MEENTGPSATADINPEETDEWLAALESLIEVEGLDRAHYMIERLIDNARRSGAYLPYSATTAYLNTIPPHRETYTPGDPALEWRIRSINRWNAMAMVVKANRKNSELGGHIASYASAATLYEIGYNHFWHAPSESHGGDLVFFQGHSAPGVYARAYLLGLIDEEQLANFRQDVAGNGLTSYPAPVAHAAVLAVSDGLDGSRADHGDLPGALHAVSREPRPRGHAFAQGLGVHG